MGKLGPFKFSVARENLKLNPDMSLILNLVRDSAEFHHLKISIVSDALLMEEIQNLYRAFSLTLFSEKNPKEHQVVFLVKFSRHMENKFLV
jgi:hypothetical protein